MPPRLLVIFNIVSHAWPHCLLNIAKPLLSHTKALHFSYFSHPTSIIHLLLCIGVCFYAKRSSLAISKFSSSFYLFIYSHSVVSKISSLILGVFRLLLSVVLFVSSYSIDSKFSSSVSLTMYVRFLYVILSVVSFFTPSYSPNFQNFVCIFAT